MGARALEESLAAAAAPEEQGLLEDVKGLLKEGKGPVKENAVEQEENAAAKLAISTREATSTQAQGGCGSPAAHADSVPPVLPASAPPPLEDGKGPVKEGKGPVKEEAVEQGGNAAAKLAPAEREATSTQAEEEAGGAQLRSAAGVEARETSGDEDGKGSVKDEKGPVKNANGPVGERKGSVKDEKRPVEEAKGPVKEAGVGLRLKRVDGRVTVKTLNPTP